MHLALGDFIPKNWSNLIKSAKVFQLEIKHLAPTVSEVIFDKVTALNVRFSSIANAMMSFSLTFHVHDTQARIQDLEMRGEFL